MFDDLKNTIFMYLKAGMFVLIGTLCFVLLVLGNPTLQTAILLVLMIWSFARVYYFMFYVIEKYIDPTYKFASIFSFVVYLLRRKK